MADEELDNRCQIVLLASASDSLPMKHNVLYTKMNTAGEIRPFQLAAHKRTSGNQACTSFLSVSQEDLFTC